MDTSPFSFSELSPDLFVYHGAVNTGILRQGSRAVLIDCDDTLSPARLAELGIAQVERIYCTQHRRPNTAGIPVYSAAAYAPRDERLQFEAASAYWNDWHNRWHLYHFRPGPLAPLQDIALAGTVGEGDEFAWGGFEVRVLETPGMTDGAVSYCVRAQAAAGGAGSVVFSGDVLYGPGQVWDVHSLQKNMGSGFSDYHGYLGAAKTLIASLAKLAGCGAACLVPSHGQVILDPVSAVNLTAQRMQQLFRNYASTSAINFYFPELFGELCDDPWRMAPAATVDFPDFILPVADTSFGVRSESGALFLIDCGGDAVLDKLNAWQAEGRITQLEGCWVTHYHDDHVDALHHLAGFWHTPIYAQAQFAEIVEHPSRFYLPCISPAPAVVEHAPAHGETWQWHEFEMTALHFPGQTFYHGGLLLRGHGQSVLFSGDSFAPTGMDDYTAGNRNFLGDGRGYRRCIELIRQHRPDWILNQHQKKAFHFSNEQLDTMEHRLAAREAMLRELLPWEDINYGTDEGWIRTYPYELEGGSLESGSGAACLIEVRASQHASQPVAWSIEAVLPPGWSCEVQILADVPAVGRGGDAFSRRAAVVHIPAGARQGCYPVAFRVTWGGRCLGQVCHALVRVI